MPSALKSAVRVDRVNGRDLAVTSDFRSVLGAVLAGHLKLDAGKLNAVLPGAPANPALGGLIRA